MRHQSTAVFLGGLESALGYEASSDCLDILDLVFFRERDGLPGLAAEQLQI
jgi:hypothetical protein